MALSNIIPRHFDNAARLTDCIKYLLNNEYNSDIEFHFKKESAVLHGHKFIIGLRSSVFNAMFNSQLSMAENQKICRIEDISASSFYELLKFMYKDEANISERNFGEIMYAAHKYSINYLERLCCKYVEEKLNADNCCMYFKQSFLYDNDLSKKCLEIIDKEIALVIEKKSWQDLTESQITTIIKRDTLEISEYSLFDGLMAWAKGVCEREDIDFNVDKIREIFPVFEYVRFPTMTLGEFSIFHRNNKTFLRPEEIADIFQYINAGIKSDKLAHSIIRRKPKKIPAREMLNSKRSKVSKKIAY